MPKLIPELRNAWRMLSMQLAAMAVVFGTLEHEVQVSVLQFLHIPAERITAVLGLLFMASRLLHQPSLKPVPIDDAQPPKES